MVQINIYRERYTKEQTMGSAIVRKNGLFVGTFATLERPWINNQRNISCIPAGNYDVEHWNSDKHTNSFHIKNVKDRDNVLIHKGNFGTIDTLGCVLWGALFEDINKDGLKDVIYSTKAMELLNDICKDETDIKLIIS